MLGAGACVCMYVYADLIHGLSQKQQTLPGFGGSRNGKRKIITLLQRNKFKTVVYQACLDRSDIIK